MITIGHSSICNCGKQICTVSKEMGNDQIYSTNIVLESHQQVSISIVLNCISYKNTP